MKDKLKGILIGVLIGAVLSGSIASAAWSNWIEAYYNDIKIVVDGKKISPTDANGNSVEPFIVNGTTYLPVRAVASALGKSVYWDGSNFTVYLGETGGLLSYPSLRLEDATNIGAGSFSWDDLFIDNYGNTYSSALHYYWSVRGNTAEYLLNMKYSRFKGTIAVKKGISSTYEGNIKVKADEKVIYTSPVITKNSAPIPLDLDIRGCNNFQIEFDGGFAEYIYLADCGFYQ